MSKAGDGRRSHGPPSGTRSPGARGFNTELYHQTDKLASRSATPLVSASLRVICAFEEGEPHEVKDMASGCQPRNPATALSQPGLTNGHGRQTYATKIITSSGSTVTPARLRTTSDTSPTAPAVRTLGQGPDLPRRRVGPVYAVSHGRGCIQARQVTGSISRADADGRESVP